MFFLLKEQYNVGLLRWQGFKHGASALTVDSLVWICRNKSLPFFDWVQERGKKKSGFRMTPPPEGDEALDDEGGVDGAGKKASLLTETDMARRECKAREGEEGADGGHRHIKSEGS